MNNLIKNFLKKRAEAYAEKEAFKKELEKIKYGENGKKHMSMGKKLTLFLLINFTIVEIYSLVCMFYLKDISPLSTLISVVIGEVVAFSVYSLKSMKENTQHGITYEMAMLKEQTKDDEEAVG